MTKSIKSDNINDAQQKKGEVMSKRRKVIDSTERKNKPKIATKIIGLGLIATMIAGGVALVDNVSLNDKDYRYANYELSDRSNLANKDAISTSKIIGTIETMDATRDFCIVNIGNSKNNKLDELDNYFNNGINCGILFCSNATCKEEYIADLKYLQKILETYDVTYPCLIDIASLKGNEGLLLRAIDGIFEEDKLKYTDILGDLCNRLDGFAYLYGSQDDFDELEELWFEEKSNYDFTKTPKALKVEPKEVVKNVENVGLLCYGNSVVFSENPYNIDDNKYIKKITK